MPRMPRRSNCSRAQAEKRRRLSNNSELSWDILEEPMTDDIVIAPITPNIDMARANPPHTTNLQEFTRSPEFRARERDRMRFRRSHATQMGPGGDHQTCNSFSLAGAAFSYDYNLNYKDHKKIQIGDLCITCDYCEAVKFRGETPGMCCNGGKIKLSFVKPPPEPIRTLYSGDYDDSRHFIDNIRHYNECFRMTSFGATGGVSRMGGPDGFMPTVRVQGQIYHRIGSLLPNPEEEAKFLQIYFVGGSEVQIDRRTQIFSGAKRNIISLFQSLFDQHNELVKDCRIALNSMPSDDHRIVIRADKAPQGEHPGRFNIQAANEIAAIMTEGFVRDIIIKRRGTGLERIAETHCHYDALEYPLIFWEGQETYYFGIKQVALNGQPTEKNVSSMSLYSYYFMIRHNHESENFILKCGELLSQFAVDMWCKIEGERLRYLETHQKDLYADQYFNLRDAIARDGDASNIGKRVILPSTHIGSPRHMHEYSQDSLAYVRIHGRPDLFITFTCNPKWPEFVKLLSCNEKLINRHDLTARVFRQKVIKFVNVIKKHQIFGPMRCFMYTIEWQKRGLPHMHLLLWLENRIRPEQIDHIISAELPDRMQDPVLYEIVSKNMIHGPCGYLHMNERCMANNQKRCSKKFPRAFINETSTADDGYPLYKRRSPHDGGQSFIKEPTGELIDNRWVVPYSPILLRMFDAHINVEYCHSVKSIKYVCKYINKGSDMAVFQTETTNTDEATSNNEIEQYKLGRYISTNEAFWRIFGFPIHDRFPAVEHLQVHLENGQRVLFNRNAHIQNTLMAQNPPESTLTAFFRLCREDPFAKTILYSEVPRYYTWANKRFRRRLRGTQVVTGPEVDGNIFQHSTIGRIYTVNPRDRECFYLRLLLINIKGPTSFEYLRTVEGRVCGTFEEACRLRGLIENDNQWVDCLREAAAFSIPTALRSLFAIILTECLPSDPRALWEMFKEDLSEDLLERQRRENPQMELDYSDLIFNEALILIENLTMRMTGQLLIALNMPSPVRGHLDPFNSEIVRETSYDRDEMNLFVETNRPKLYQDQENAYQQIMSAVEKKSGGLFFLDAPGGTGKTFLINLILAEIRRTGNIAVAVASSGIAATLLKGGRTAHSSFKLPLDVNRSEFPTCGITKSMAKGKLLQQCQLIIWDECSMAHKKSLEALDRCLKDMRDDNSIMGGVVVVLSGDFRQTLPVIPRSTPADELNACLKQSYLWPSVKSLFLRTNMRVHLNGDVSAGCFANKLLSIGDGIAPTIPGSSSILLTPDLCQTVSDREELINKVFENLPFNISNKDWLSERAILTPLNETVSAINIIIQEKLVDVTAKTYLAIDKTVEDEQAVNYPTEFLNSLSPPGLPEFRLELKVGSPIILLRNLDPPRLCNGTRLCVKRLENNSILATILNGPYKGEDAFIPRIPLITSDLIFQFKRIQFPVRLAYAMTINKSQGQSLKISGLDLTTECFSHGQLYVACSRVGSPSNLYVLASGNKTKNIVYQQALR